MPDTAAHDVRSPEAAATAKDATHIPLGLFAIVLGLGAGYVAWGYDLGSVVDMGAGFFPFAIAVILVCLGIGVIVRGGSDLPPEEAVVPAMTPAERRASLMHVLRVLGATLGGLLVFALILDPAGMVVSVMVLTGIVSLAHPGPKPGPVLALAVGLAAFSSIVFVSLLKVQVTIWPGIF